MNVDSMEDKLQELLLLKFEAGLLRPYSYVQGYLKLHKYMEKRMSVESVTKIVGIMRIYRPTFQVIIKSLSDVDMLASEITFERQLLEYDYVFYTFGVPACLWRRTGEIYKANKEFADLVGLPLQYFQQGRVSIYELMTEESFVNYFEKFVNIAFDVTQKAVLTSCVLQVSDSIREMVGRDRTAGLWKNDVHKDLEPFPLVLGATGEEDIESSDPNAIVAFFKEFWESSKKLDKSKLNSEYVFDNANKDNSIFINQESNQNEIVSTKDLLEDMGLDHNANPKKPILPDPDDFDFLKPNSSKISFSDTNSEHNTNSKNSHNSKNLQPNTGSHGDNQKNFVVDDEKTETVSFRAKSDDASSSTSSPKIEDFGIPRKKIACCFSLTIRRDKNCLPVAIVGNFIPSG
ncbi:hypothetical protein BB561_006562 [Smittium simulii]|uniref:ERT1/acuK family PAS domain-containing protein n=1 Tax=Smittium simulii TaxID=133385 RepID=A0A2T9Y354_9FUNG|nr:hypothetical protein BB561_006562 [Smittium simulii]